MIKLKNVLMYITLIWSSVMSAAYLTILFELPLFALISFLPLGEYICEFLTILLLLGIWVVPVLYIITISLIFFLRKKSEEDSQNKRLTLFVIILPICLAVLMLSTGFMERLA